MKTYLIVCAVIACSVSSCAHTPAALEREAVVVNAVAVGVERCLPVMSAALCGMAADASGVQMSTAVLAACNLAAAQACAWAGSAIRDAECDRLRNVGMFPLPSWCPAPASQPLSHSRPAEEM